MKNETVWNAAAMMEMAKWTRSTAQVAVSLSNKRCVHNDREAVMLLLTYLIPKYPSKSANNMGKAQLDDQTGKPSTCDITVHSYAHMTDRSVCLGALSMDFKCIHHWFIKITRSGPWFSLEFYLSMKRLSLLGKKTWTFLRHQQSPVWNVFKAFGCKTSKL